MDDHWIVSAGRADPNGMLITFFMLLPLIVRLRVNAVAIHLNKLAILSLKKWEGVRSWTIDYQNSSLSLDTIVRNLKFQQLHLLSSCLVWVTLVFDPRPPAWRCDSERIFPLAIGLWYGMLENVCQLRVGLHRCDERCIER